MSSLTRVTSAAEDSGSLSAPAFAIPSLALRAWAFLQRHFAAVRIQRRDRHLRLCESISLGDKRVVALLQLDSQRFLIAATPQNICLLQALGPAVAEPEDSRQKP